jgi:hypothetical protein
MTIEEIVESRGIKEILHFTTHNGLLGSLHSGALKSRKRLPADLNLSYVYKPNANARKDVAWLDYVNLSISRINKEFFGHSCRWHRAEDLWWCILSFDPAILAHPGVHFVTTNNMYSGAIRENGPSGLLRLFAPRVTLWNGNVAVRSEELPDSFTTCGQAEVLYPSELPMKHLRRIYTVRDEDADEVHAQLSGIGFREVEVLVEPDKFM